MKKIYILIYILLILSFVINTVLIFRGDYYNKLLGKLGIKEYKYGTNWSLEAWKKSIQSIKYHADVAFFGDSITYDGEWEEYFSEVNVINLGLPGDTIAEARKRTEMLANVNPDKIFILLGINSFETEKDMVILIQQYEALLDEIQIVVPDAIIYIQSVLPISHEKEQRYVENSIIAAFNEELSKIAVAKKLNYLDLFSTFIEGGSMNPDYSYDGVHLNEDGYGLWASVITSLIN